MVVYSVAGGSSVDVRSVASVMIFVSSTGSPFPSANASIHPIKLYLTPYAQIFVDLPQSQSPSINFRIRPHILTLHVHNASSKVAALLYTGQWVLYYP
jgi:hypothetical protein